VFVPVSLYCAHEGTGVVVWLAEPEGGEVGVYEGSEVWGKFLCHVISKDFKLRNIIKKAGRVKFKQMWWSFLGRVDEVSPRIREVCWCVVSVVQSG